MGFQKFFKSHGIKSRDLREEIEKFAESHGGKVEKTIKKFGPIAYEMLKSAKKPKFVAKLIEKHGSAAYRVLADAHDVNFIAGVIDEHGKKAVRLMNATGLHADDKSSRVFADNAESIFKLGYKLGGTKNKLNDYHVHLIEIARLHGKGGLKELRKTFDKSKNSGRRAVDCLLKLRKGEFAGYLPNGELKIKLKKD